MTPVLIAALIMYIKFQTPVHQMQVLLALFRCIVQGLSKERNSQSQLPSQILKDIHTIVDHYDLDPTLHICVACPKFYGLSRFTNKVLSAAETTYRMTEALPLCTEKSHPDLPPCGGSIWQTCQIGSRTFVTPIWKQVFQDLKEWIGRILAIPGIEDIMSQHQQCPAPVGDEPVRDFVDSAVFRQFKGVDGEPFMIPQVRPSRSPDLRLSMSLGFDVFNPFQSKERHAIVLSTALYMVLLSLPEHIRYRQEYIFLVTVIQGKPSKHQINHTLRRLVKQLLSFWEGIFYVQTAQHSLGRRVFIALMPAVCNTEGATQLAGCASHTHTWFCRRCLLPLNEIHNLKPET